MRTTDDSLQNYISSLLPSPSLALQKIAQELKDDDKWGINIGSIEGALLQFFIKSYNIKNILEIGTQYGYSTQWMLEALPHDGQIYTLEKDSEHHQKATKNITDKRVYFYLGDARETLSQVMSCGPFDLIFIDANKKSYPEYLDWAVKNVKQGGLIIGDNTFLFGTVLSDTPPEKTSPALWKAMREFNQKLFSHPDFQTCIVPTTEGMTVAIKK